MSKTEVIPQHDNLDVEFSGGFVCLSQENSGEGESKYVTFHLKYIPDVIAALEEIQRNGGEA